MRLVASQLALAEVLALSAATQLALSQVARAVEARRARRMRSSAMNQSRAARFVEAVAIDGILAAERPASGGV